MDSSNNQVFYWLTDNISIEYTRSLWNSDTEEWEYLKDDSYLRVVFHNTDFNILFQITKGDTGAYYSPIYPEEVEEVRDSYGESYILSSYDDECDKYTYYLREQEDFWYVCFSQDAYGKTDKFKEVYDAIHYALTTVQESFKNINNDIGYMLLSLDLSEKK